ncbi:MAG: hypothetical protein E6I97_21405 [Chloroflexi bacterium]|nr:MAG: hypothetical protein E6I97_21405 [Chloroflexota bacterium]
MSLHQLSIGTGMHHQLPGEGERGKADSTMNGQFTGSAPAGARHKPQQGDTRLHGKRLILARTACLVAGILSFGVFVASVPATYEALLSLLCTGPLCKHPTQASVQFVQQLQALGLSVQAYAIYYMMLNIVFVCAYFVVAIVLFWRRSDDWMALFAAFFLMTFAITFSSDTLEATPYWLFQFVIFLGAVSIVVFFYLFPTGRFVPRWTRWLSIAAILYWGLKYFWPPLPFNPYMNLVFSSTGFLVFVGFMVVAQVYRYLHVSNGVQRQQTKWVVFGMSIAVGGYIVFASFFAIFFPSASHSPLAAILLNTVNHLLLLLIPISIAFAILRSRLWDIDIIINRTLVYSSLTAILAVIYFASVIALQSLLSVFTGQLSAGTQTPVVIVASTLGIAALFQPLRRRLQTIIDRRFYRSRYDAARTLAAFSASLRNEVDLNQLREQLLAVVQETMQPAHVSLWLRPPEQSGQRHTRLLPRIDEEESVAP